MNYFENIKVAIESIGTNFLRSLLTLFIIAVGIASLVGILSAIDGILYSMSDNFSRLGANSFTIVPARQTIQSSGETQRADPISFEQARTFKDRYDFGAARVSLELYGPSNAVVKYRNEETDPRVRVNGVDENYLYAMSYDITEGRNFTPQEVFSGNNVALLGSSLINKLFDGKDEKAVGKSVYIGSNKYRVLGTLAEKGSSNGGGNDRRVLIPLLSAKKLYGGSNTNYRVTVAVDGASQVDDAISSAIGTMRQLRKLRAAQDNDFTIRKSDRILTRLKDMTSTLRLATVVIAGLTLLGAAIGLMNIMLVSVTERTREIGVRKALGATSRNVLIQFLTEAVTICLLGGIVGIVLGVLMGVGVTILVKGHFVMPWAWITLGIIVCVVVGIVSGLYPALKASRLDPIESLRYE